MGSSSLFIRCILCGMVAKFPILSGAMLFLCLVCASVPPITYAQTSPISAPQVGDKLTKKERWTLAVAGVTAGVSLVGAFLSFVYFRRNVKLSKQIADRTLTVEAQKL